MKKLKITLVLACLLILLPGISRAQKAYLIHQDNVKPSMVSEYEKISKEFIAKCKEYNPQTSWITATTNDLRYMYVTPIESMADIDKNPFKEMAEKMGDDFANIFKNYDKCYDSHGGYIIIHDEELTYMPEGFTQTPEGQNYRKYFYLYFKPKNQGKLKEGMKAIKEMFASKGSKSYYRVYRSGFGNMESYYMVAMAAKDEIDSVTRGKDNDELLGEGRHEVFGNAMKYVTRFEEYSGAIRPDLGYSPK
jgi:hypothetical protein